MMNFIKQAAITGCVVATSVAFSSSSIAQDSKTFQWVNQIGGTLQDSGYGVATDSKGNVYATGTYQNIGSIGLPGNYDTIISNGNYDVFLTKMDREGNLLWAHSIGGTLGDEGHAVTVDANDEVIVTGSYRGTVDFDLGVGTAIHNSNNGSVDVFIAKYDTAGNFKWVKTFGSTSLDRGFAVKTDKWNNVYFTGQFYDTIAIPDLNTNIIATPSATAIFTNDVFVAKLNAAGTFLWAKSFGGPSSDVGHSLAVDTTGNVVITGSFNGVVDFDMGTGVYNMDAADGAVFVTKWDSAGAFMWAGQINGTSNQGYLIETDLLNNIYLTGQFTGKVDFDISPAAADTFFLTSDLNAANTLSTVDGFILKLEHDGNFAWVKKFGGSGVATGRGVAIDPIGNINVVGTLSGILTLDTVQYTSYGSTDIFIYKVDKHGNTVWTSRYGGSGAEFCRAIAVDPFNAIYTVGHYVTTNSGKSNFHNGNDTVSYDVLGGYDAYVHKIGCSDTTLNVWNEIACNEYVFNNEVLTQSGQYVFHFWSEGGCDSTTILNLTVNYIDKPYITVNNFTLGVTTPYNAYKWLKNGVLISNATAATLDVTENAAYQVVVTTLEGCIDTSDVYNVNNVTSVLEHELSPLVSVYPNPFQEKVFINSPESIIYYVTNIAGIQVVSKTNYMHEVKTTSLSEGVYFLHILDKNGNLIKVEKIVKL